MVSQVNEFNLQFHEAEPDTIDYVWMEVPIQALLAAGCMSCILSMAQLSFCSWAVAAAIPFLCLSVCLRKRKKQRMVLISICALCCILILILSPNCRSGLQAAANSLFEASEARQSYRYMRFEGSNAETVHENILQAAVCLSAVLCCLVSLIPVKHLPKAALTAVLGLAAAIVYFGVLPDFRAGGLLVIGAVSSFAAALRLPGSGMLFTAGVTAILFCICLLVLPGEQSEITALNERLRDNLALHTVHFTSQAQQNIQETETKEQEEKKESEGRSGFQNGVGLQLNWKLLITVLFVLVLLFILILPAVLMDRLHRRMEKNRMGIDSPDPRTGIRAAFGYMMLWFHAEGFQRDTVPYVQLNLQSLELPEDLLRRYPETAELWQEAAYSSHEMTKEQRDIVYTFMCDVVRTIWNRQTWRGKCRMKYRFALVEERIS